MFWVFFAVVCMFLPATNDRLKNEYRCDIKQLPNAGLQSEMTIKITLSHILSTGQGFGSHKMSQGC